jgi:hypothetical protein
VKHYSDSNFVVICTVRNVERTLVKEFKNLTKAFSGTKHVNWIIVESDSEDSTPKLGEQLSKENSNVLFVSLGKLAEKIPYRTARIAHSRNVALKKLSNENYFSSLDYIILADIDGRNRDFNKEAFQSSWNIPDWDVMTANQDGLYYDIWALRHETWCPSDCWIDAKKLQHEIGLENSIDVSVKSKMIVIKEDIKPIRVLSAFGGLAVYKSELFEHMNYLEGLLEGEEICDHVFVNLKLSKLGKKIFINPRMINYRETMPERVKRISLVRMVWNFTRLFWKKN